MDRVIDSLLSPLIAFPTQEVSLDGIRPDWQLPEENFIMVRGKIWELLLRLPDEIVDDLDLRCEDDERQKTIILSFLAGAMSMGFLWLLRALWHSVPDTLLEHGDDDNLTWIDPWNVPSKIIFSRIGELPIPFKRKHWPWETMRRKMPFSGGSERTQGEEPTSVVEEGDDSVRKNGGGSSLHSRDEVLLAETVNDNDGIDGDGNVTATIAEDPQEGKTEPKKDLCIGSIFGLDVGGTLAKLVYFEQKPSDFDPLQPNLRDPNFLQSTSAQSILKAARLEAAAGRGLYNSGTSAAAATMYDRQGSIPSSGKLESKDNNGSPGSTGSKPHHFVRRRSLSVGFMGRLKQIQKEKEEEEWKIDATNLQNEKRMGDSVQPHHQSEEDFQRYSDESQQHVSPTYNHQSRHSIDFLSMVGDTMKGIYDSHGEEYNEILFGHSDSAIAYKPMRCISMVDLTSQSQQLKAEALDRFYSFARRLDSNEHAVRDDKLSFYSRQLGGQFHFIRFETRRMSDAMDLIRYNNLHLNIFEMG